jgi:GTP-binding protein HflX
MEKAILVNLATDKIEKDGAEESMEELAGLAAAAGAEVVKKVFQYRPRASPKYFIGEGKVEEIQQLKGALQADIIIFDHNLSPIQQRSLENKFKVKVADRTQLIMDIFAQRARSNEGKLQVELAQLNYMLPRLTGKGIGLSRLGAGIRTRGPGEKKLEEDRRRITDRIVKIKREILSIQERRASQRESRKTSPVPTVSLVGYTSAGKSTLFNTLAGESRFTSPNLFATLDPVLRRVTYPDGLYFFLSDTVGFIKKLPTELVTSFRATLEEVKEADCICHVIDATSSHARSRADAVEAILSDLGVPDIPIFKIFNKIDLLPETDRGLLLLKNETSGSRTHYISAKTGLGIEGFMEKLKQAIFSDFRLYYLQIPKDHEGLTHSLGKRALILKRRERDGFFEFKVMAESAVMLNYLSYLSRGEESW